MFFLHILNNSYVLNKEIIYEIHLVNELSYQNSYRKSNKS